MRFTGISGKKPTISHTENKYQIYGLTIIQAGYKIKFIILRSDIFMLIIDRIENGIAVIENDDGSHFEMKCGQLPMSIREGDVIKSENGRYVIDYEMTQKCRDEIRNLQKKIQEK